MKSSAISLVYDPSLAVRPTTFKPPKPAKYLLQLIDSPGHVDFSSEVSNAVRLCDGALVLVDVVEGVCVQTETVLRQAWIEGVKPLLVLNKMDRLISDLGMTPEAAYSHLIKIIEQVNMVTSSISMSSAMENRDSGSADAAEFEIEDADEVEFEPTKGNVVFCSAHDGWAFSIPQMANFYGPFLNIKPKKLSKILWGEFYCDVKKEKVMKKPFGKIVQPLFVQTILHDLWKSYEEIFTQQSTERLQKRIKALKLKIRPRELATTDWRVKLRAVLSRWMPLSDAILGMAIKHLPSPADAQYRIPRIWTGTESNCAFSNDVLTSNKDSEHMVAFISKMVSFPKRSFDDADRDANAERDRRNGAAPVVRQAYVRGKFTGATSPKPAESTDDDKAESESDQADSKSEETTESDDEPKHESAEDLFLGFGRVYSGTLHADSVINIYAPRYKLDDPERQKYVTKKDGGFNLYQLMGSNLSRVDSVPAGALFGISGLGHHVVRTAMLASDADGVPPFASLIAQESPILRVAIRPKRAKDINALQEGLKLLAAADAAVDTMVQEDGQHVIAVAGELHLERCITDLRQSFAKGVDFTVSEPIVPFRETIVYRTSDPDQKDNDDKPLVVSGCVPNGMVTFELRAAPLPDELVTFLEHEKFNATDDVDALREFVVRLKAVLAKSSDPIWRDLDPSRLWRLGSRQHPSNVLVNGVDDLLEYTATFASPDKSLLADEELKSTARHQLFKKYSNSLVSGFMLATNAGPLCEEPMRGVGLFLEKIDVAAGVTQDSVESLGAVSGQIISTFCDLCRSAFSRQAPRLVQPMYNVTLQTTGQALKRLFALLDQRRGRITRDDIYGASNFIIEALLPVQESFGFGKVLRTRTRGVASPQLVFSHWETIDEDPFWVPTTQEELEDFGMEDLTVRENYSFEQITKCRRRKGLAIEEKLVVDAEKQRTLKR